MVFFGHAAPASPSMTPTTHIVALSRMEVVVSALQLGALPPVCGSDSSERHEGDTAGNELATGLRV